jgi:transposase-like protein
MDLDLTAIYARFPTKGHCVRFLEIWYWNGKPICPYCSRNRSSRLPKENRYHCNSCHSTFSVTVNTPFHHSHLPLQKWFLAVALVTVDNKLSVRQLAKELSISKNTACLLLSRIQQGMLQTHHRNLFAHLTKTLEN